MVCNSNISSKELRISKTKMTNLTQRGANDGYMKIIRDNDSDDFTPRVANRYPPPAIGQTMHDNFYIK